MDELDRAAVKKPAHAKEILAAHIDSIVLTPGPDGYSAKLRFQNRTGRDPEGGGLFVENGCGGVRGMIPLNVELSLASEISPVRGLSLPEHLVRVTEPRLVIAAQVPLP